MRHPNLIRHTDAHCPILSRRVATISAISLATSRALFLQFHRNMNTLLKTVSFLAINTAMIASIASAQERDPRTLSEQQRKIRLQHARELLGKHYKKSAVRNGEGVQKINSRI